MTNIDLAAHLFTYFKIVTADIHLTWSSSAKYTSHDMVLCIQAQKHKMPLVFSEKRTVKCRHGHHREPVPTKPLVVSLHITQHTWLTDKPACRFSSTVSSYRLVIYSYIMIQTWVVVTFNNFSSTYPLVSSSNKSGSSILHFFLPNQTTFHVH